MIITTTRGEQVEFAANDFIDAVDMEPEGCGMCSVSINRAGTRFAYAVGSTAADIVAAVQAELAS